MTISGPETVVLTTGPSDGAGIAEAVWKTDKPKGNRPGTTPGDYTATTTIVTLNGYTWDGVMTAHPFAIVQ